MEGLVLVFITLDDWLGEEMRCPECADVIMLSDKQHQHTVVLPVISHYHQHFQGLGLAPDHNIQYSDIFCRG